jgi:hypothetical protein
MKAINVIALVLFIVGGLNWGLVGLFQFDLVVALFGGQDALLSRVFTRWWASWRCASCCRCSATTMVLPSITPARTCATPRKHPLTASLRIST